MGAPVVVKNAVDSWVNQQAQTKNYGNKARMQLRAGSPNQKYGFLYFAKPWPNGATIISAKLRLYSGDSWAGSVTLSVARTAAKWAGNRINWNNQPGITGATATLAKTGAAAGTLWEVDVTSLIQTVANGGAWFGFRIWTNSTAENWIHATQSGSGSRRPVLVVQWSDAPDEPDRLRPSSGRSVSLTKPIVAFNFNDVSGDTDLASVQVQFGSSEANVNAGVTTWDSAEVAATAPELDLSLTSFPALADAAVTWWRARAKDGAGLWSVWADAVSFRRDTKGVLAITSPAASPNNFLWDPTPTVSWTFTGRVQKAYQVAIALASDPNNWLWDSGKITSTDTSMTIPIGAISDAGLTYLIIVRVWDTINREATPNDPVYVEATVQATVNYDATISAKTVGLQAVSDVVLPIEHLTWSRSGTVQPASWVIQRSPDGGVTWYNIADRTDGESAVADTNRNVAITTTVGTGISFANGVITADDVGRGITGGSIPAGTTIASFNSATTATLSQAATAAAAITANIITKNYKYDDVAAAPYEAYVWKVIPVANGRMTSGNPTVTGEVRRLAPFLMRADGTDAVCFLNPERSRRHLDVQELHEVLGGPPVVVTQRLGGRAGSVKGRLTGDPMPGVSAREQYARFLRLRRDSGQKMVVYIANESFTVVAYNFQDDVVTDTSGITYTASFDWVEV